LYICPRLKEFPKRKNQKMKKILLATIIAITALSSCKKEGEETSSSPKTTITGTAFAELDASSNAPGLERAPAGVRVTAMINPNDLMVNPDTSKQYDDYRYSTTLNVNGDFKLEIPARSKGTLVKLYFDDFIANQIYDVNGNSTRKAYKVPSNPMLIIVYGGTTTVKDVAYN
jgi:hypothetical protein